MYLDSARDLVARFRDSLRATAPELAFEFELRFPDSFFHDVWDQEVPAPGCSKLSGVYLFLDASLKVLYIGKATKNNLASEIYNRKINKRSNVGKASARFDNSELARWAPTSELAETIRSGHFKLAAFVIEPASTSSLIEVALQTACWNRRGDNWWPLLNKQIA